MERWSDGQREGERKEAGEEEENERESLMTRTLGLKLDLAPMI